MHVLASDFDGTLLFDEEFRESDLKKIKEFQEKGNLFGLCTGRPLKGVDAVTNGKINYDFYILVTGALVLDKNHQIIFKGDVTRDTMHRFFERYQKDYEIFIQANYQIYTFQKEEIVGITRKTIHSLDEVEGDIYGFSLNGGNEEKAKIVCEDIKTHFPELDAYQNKQYVDVVSNGCSKGRGIEELKKYLNVEKIAGIGDSYNDMPMLKTADISFTFTSSPDIVKKEATHIVDSTKEAIEILMENKND